MQYPIRPPHPAEAVRYATRLTSKVCEYELSQTYQTILPRRVLIKGTAKYLGQHKFRCRYSVSTEMISGIRGSRGGQLPCKLDKFASESQELGMYYGGSQLSVIPLCSSKTRHRKSSSRYERASSNTATSSEFAVRQQFDVLRADWNELDEHACRCLCLEVAEVVAQPHCPIWFTHFTHLYTHPPYAIVSARPKVMSGYRSESLTYSDKNYRCIGVWWWNGPSRGNEGPASDSRTTSSRTDTTGTTETLVKSYSMVLIYRWNIGTGKYKK